MWYLEIFLVLLSLIIFCRSLREKNGIPTNWPIIGMLPALLINIHRIHAFVIELLDKCHLTFHFKGPCFTNMDMLATLDPINVHHVMSKNFGNYPKGEKFHEMLDVLGDGVVNTDGLVWQYHRKMAHAFLGHQRFYHFMVNKTWDKVENGLIPLLNHICDHEIIVDLQDLFTRLTFDTICCIIMNQDPKSLSIDFPSNPASKALDEAEAVIFHRYVVPTFVWKFQRWLNVGKEKKYKEAWGILDSFIYKCIEAKREELRNEGVCQDGDEVSNNDLLSLYIEEDENQKTPIGTRGDKFLRDTILNNLLAGRDTTSTTLSWLFYLLSKNPDVVSKIRKELDNVMLTRENFKEENSKLVYLHASLCETLRLYPPVAFEAKAPIEHDVLPSGHHVNPNMQIIFDTYAMGRMKSIWGEDCCEFKPERWISEQGKLKHEPSYKFFSFNAGPRTCLGKNMAFTQMKVVAATFIRNYDIQVVEDHLVVPDLSIILHMKYGFKVKMMRVHRH
ncbi:unnamed protein product [Amaranthus hypochondriacus]